MLEPYRVLDLTNECGLLCGQILADLGADVIAVEPPGGSSARKLGPQFQGPERVQSCEIFQFVSWCYLRCVCFLRPLWKARVDVLYLLRNVSF